MRQSVAINLVGIAAVLGAGWFVPYFTGPDLPALNLWIVRGSSVLFVLGWLVLLVRPQPASAAGRVAWPFSSRFVVWGGIVLLSGAFWLQMPYADESVMLACIICQVCTVTLYIMTTLEPPPSRGRMPLAPLGLPLSIGVYLIVHPMRLSVALVVFDIAYAFVIMAMQRFVQGTVDDAYDARRAAEAALVQVAAERDAKTRFLASASHDLGQPLQAARLSFDQAMSSPDAVQRSRAAKRVGWAFDATEQLLRQILDHLRLESGMMQPTLTKMAIGPLIARIGELNEPAARLAGVDLGVVASRVEAFADAAMTERVVSNLVGNSLRHAKASRILIGARRRDSHVRLWVIDNGEGIPAADEARLFDEYVQGSNHGDEIRGGFGLGLASSRRLARLMGGDLGLEPGWRNGSAFWLDLPVAPPA
jgi:signal transduction histidine kinase